MRIVLLVSLIFLLCCGAQAEFLGIKKSSERVTFRLKEPIDSAYGIERKPDSVHIWIRCDTGTVASATPLDYKARSTTYPFADITNTPIDTTKDYGDTAYWFTGVLSNFGTTTMSQVTISVDLYTGRYYRTTDATYQVITDSLTYDLKQGRDSAGIAARQAKQANDSLALYDTRWDSTLAVFADANTLFKNRLLRMRDSIDVILDTLQTHDGWVAKEASVQIVRDTLALYDTRWDSLLAVVADANTLFKNRLLRIRDSIDVILDTLQSQDGWGAKEASTQIIRDTLALYDIRWDSLLAVVADANTLVKNRLLRIRDSVDVILDSLQLYDNWLKDSVHNSALLSKEALDTLKLYDNWLRDSVHNQSVATLLGIPVEWTAAQRDSAIARILAMRDSITAVHAKLNIVGDSANADIAVARADSNLTKTTRDTAAAAFAKAKSALDSLQAQDDWIAKQATLVAANDSLASISTWLVAKLDSTAHAAGLALNSSSTQGFSTNSDTLHVWWGATELLKVLYWHVGKGPGSVEIDSTRAYWLP